VFHPQVDDRLNGDGAGIALGVNDPILGWVIGGVATLIWISYFIAQKDFGDFEDKVGRWRCCRVAFTVHCCILLGSWPVSLMNLCVVCKCSAYRIQACCAMDGHAGNP
jgi:hypothetical protein